MLLSVSDTAQNKMEDVVDRLKEEKSLQGLFSNLK